MPRSRARTSAKVGGTTQNDILKEYIARGTYIFPPEGSMRLITDVFAWCKDNLPAWNTISISGYHMREAGCTAVQEVAFTFANAIAYCEAALKAGLDFDEFAPRLSFFFASFTNLVEEVAKFRAARRMWAHLAQERFGAKDPRSMMLRFHTQTGGSTLTAQQPENNIVRTAIQALAAVLGGTQSLHTNSMDEALALPTEKAVQIALRTQQVIALRVAASPTSIDPLGGSYYVEKLTDRIEEDATKYLDRIEDMGGALQAIEMGYQQREIQEASYRYQMSVDNGHRTVVGVNQFTTDEEERPEILRVREEVVRRQVERLNRVRAERDSAKAENLLEAPGRRREVRHQPDAGAHRVRRELRDHRRDLRRAARRLRRAARIPRLLGRCPPSARRTGTYRLLTQNREQLNSTIEGLPPTRCWFPYSTIGRSRISSRTSPPGTSCFCRTSTDLRAAMLLDSPAMFRQRTTNGTTC